MRFSDLVMDHFSNPRNVGTLPCPSGEGSAGSAAAGVFMVLQVQLDGDTIIDARFKTYGCVPAIASGSFLTEWAKGHKAIDLLTLPASFLIDALGGLPKDRRFCAQLAIDAMRAALQNATTEVKPA